MVKVTSPDKDLSEFYIRYVSKTTGEPVFYGRCKHCIGVDNTEHKRKKIASSLQEQRKAVLARQKWREENRDKDAENRRKVSRTTGRALSRLKNIYPEKYAKYRDEEERPGLPRGKARLLALRRIRDEHRETYEYFLDEEREREGFERVRRRTSKDHSESVGAVRYKTLAGYEEWDPDV